MYIRSSFHNPSIALMIALGTLVSLSACKKDEAEPPVVDVPTGGGSNTTTPNTTPTFTGAAAVLAAVSTASTQEIPGFGTVAVDINTGVGYFRDAAGASVQAGTVSCNDNALTYANGAYAYTPGAMNPTGIDFGSGVTWNVGGGNGFSAFTRNTNAIAFPSAGSITSSATVDRSAGYTLATDFVNDADSVYFIIGNVLLRRGPNTGSCTFSSSELGALAAGQNLAMVAAFNYYNENIDGKEVYFIKERVLSRSVTVQ